MKPLRLAIIAGAGLVVTAGSAIVVAESFGVDTLLLAEHMLSSGKNDTATQQGHEPSVNTLAKELADMPVKKEMAPGGHPAGTPPEHKKVGSAGPHDGNQQETGKSFNPLEFGQSILSDLAGLIGLGGASDSPSTANAHVTEMSKNEGKKHAPANVDAPAADAHAKSAEPAKHEPTHDTGHADAENGTPPFDPAAFMLPPGKSQPWRLFRDLQHAQDRVVMGQSNALAEYRRRIAAASGKMLALPDEAWESERNVLSAAAFVMGGGGVHVAQRILSKERPQTPPFNLLRGALAYAKGKYYDAYNLFYPIDPEALPISLGGQVALVKAMLISPRDLDRAMGFLDLARRLAPETLVEEAALRRQIRILAETGDVDKFFAVAGTYMRRFPKSALLSDFLRNFAFGALKLSQKHEERVAAEIDELEAQLGPDARLYLLSIIARGATVFGNFNLAQKAAEQSLALAGNDKRLKQRLELYKAASSLTGTDTLKQATSELTDMKESVLGTEDARLLDAARVISEQIHKPLTPIDLPPAGTEDDKKEKTGKDMPVGSTEPAPQGEDFLPPIIAKSDALLRKADQVLEW